MPAIVVNNRLITRWHKSQQFPQKRVRHGISGVLDVSSLVFQRWVLILPTFVLYIIFHPVPNSFDRIKIW
jgi:hypothetical protein